MISRILSLSICLLSVLACKKEPQVEEHYICSNLIENSVGTKLLPSEDLKIIDSLFQLNSLDKTNLQFSRVAVSQLSNSTYVNAVQYKNGLRLFWEGATFVFDSKGLFDESFDVNEDAIMLDTIPSMNPGDFVRVFRKTLESDPAFRGSRQDILDACINVEFGYLDTNIIHPYQSSSYIKAWYLSVDNASPEIIFNDESGEVFRYSSGISFAFSK